MTTTQTSRLPATEPSVWFITGCSTGFGRELAKQAIEHGHRTVVTARDPSTLEGYAAMENALVLQLDVTQPDQVAAAIASRRGEVRPDRRAREQRRHRLLRRR